MGMSSYILDNVDLFFEIGDKKIEEYAEDVEQAIYQVWSDNI